jgi:hypothetical protein
MGKGFGPWKTLGKIQPPSWPPGAVSHRPLPFPTAAKQSRGPLSHRPYGELFYLQKHFLFLTQPDISFAKKSGHFHLLITLKFLQSEKIGGEQKMKFRNKKLCYGSDR